VSGELALQLSILVPLLGAGAVLLAGRWPNLREGCTLFAGIALLAVVLQLLPLALSGGAPRVEWLEVVPGLSLALALEPLGMLFALIASALWIVTSIYSIGYMRAHREEHQTRFYAAFAIALASAMGVAFAANMFTLFLFYEVLTLSTYPLVTHHGTEEARRGGRTYLRLLLATSIGLQLLAIGWTYAEAGTLRFTPGGVFAEDTPHWLIGVLYGLFIFGIGKAAVMPFHRWLPAAMVAPTPVSALLHAVAVVKAGVFTVIKVTVFLFGTERLQAAGANDWLIYVAGLTILLASLIAMTRDNLKARLAYSTVSQLGYVVLGGVLATSTGVLGGGLHIAMHAVAKITLFFAAGAVLVASHRTAVSELDGLGRSMPFTFAAFAIGAMSIVGLPPFGGMWSKWYLSLATIESGHWLLLAVVLLSSLLNVLYLLAVPARAFFAPAPRDAEEHGEAPLACLIAMGITSAGCVALFFFPELLYRLTQLLIQA